MSAFILKIIAMLTMTIYHIGEVFSMPLTYRIIGRIAFPLYAMMVIDGYLHLRNDRKRLMKYMFFLLVSSIVSEPLFDLCFSGTPFTMETQNQVLQFLTFVIGCYMCDLFNNKIISVVIWICITYLNYALAIGYYATGILFMLLLMFAMKKRGNDYYPLLLLSAVSLLTFGELFEQLYIQLYDFSKTMYYFQYYIKHGTVVLYTFLAYPFMVSYNGSYGPVSKSFKVFYRWFYPLHLFALYIINRYI
ncbi:MAG: hypothetical protein IJ115_02720 [Erysipelotrichaceae bacterium]|nr:hypothetical protein [Erysipelotrichaceae bacterium]